MEKNNMIEHLVFDCSDVLIKFHAEEVLQSLLPGLYTEHDRFKTFFDNTVWHEYDIGKISTDQAHAGLLKHFSGQERAIIADYLAGWTDHYTPMPGIRELLPRLHAAGYKLYILSDYPEVFEKLYDHFDYLKTFDGRMVSYEVGLAKSDGRAIFDCFLDKFHLAPETCFFTDDTPFNIEAAKQSGMNAHLFTGTDDYIAALERLTGRPLE